MSDITIDQINATLAAKPEIKTALLGSLKNDVLAGMKAEGVIVRTKDEETQFLSNYETNVIPGKVQAEIGSKIKAVHDQYDADLLELTGEKKLPNEKTYEFMKRKLTELKASKGSGDNQVLSDKIKDLETKIKQYEGYVAPDEVNKIKDQYFKGHLGMKLDTTLAKKAIAVPAHITDEKQKQTYIEQQKEFIKAAFMHKYTAKDDGKGNIVFYEGDKLLTDTKTAAALSEEQLINDNFSFYFMPDKKPAGGAGSGAGGNGKEVDPNEAELKTKKQVMDYLSKKGMTSGGADFNKEYSRIIKEYAITEPGE